MSEIRAGLEAAQKAEEYLRRAALVRQYEGNADLEPNPVMRARAEDRARFWEQQARELVQSFPGFGAQFWSLKEHC